MPRMCGAIRMAARLRVALAAVVLALGTPCLSPAGAQALDDVGLEAGRRAYELSDYEKAIKVLQDAAAKNPRNGEVLLLLAKSHFELRQFDAAVANAERAVAVAPENSVYHEWLGRSFGEKASKSSWFSALSLARKAQQEFETAVRLNQKNYSAFQALIEFDCAAPGIAGGGEDKALPKIEQLAAMDEAEGHYAAGNCRRQKKDYPAAEAEFDKALVNAKSPDLIFDIGDYALKRSQPERLLAVVDCRAEGLAQRCQDEILSRGCLDPAKAKARRGRIAASRIFEYRAEAYRLSASGAGTRLAGSPV